MPPIRKLLRELAALSCILVSIPALSGSRASVRACTLASVAMKERASADGQLDRGRMTRARKVLMSIRLGASEKELLQSLRAISSGRPRTSVRGETLLTIFDHTTIAGLDGSTTVASQHGSICSIRWRSLADVDQSSASLHTLQEHLSSAFGTPFCGIDTLLAPHDRLAFWAYRNRTANGGTDIVELSIEKGAVTISWQPEALWQEAGCWPDRIRRNEPSFRP